MSEDASTSVQVFTAHTYAARITSIPSNTHQHRNQENDKSKGTVLGRSFIACANAAPSFLNLGSAERFTVQDEDESKVLIFPVPDFTRLTYARSYSSSDQDRAEQSLNQEEEESEEPSSVPLFFTAHAFIGTTSGKAAS